MTARTTSPPAMTTLMLLTGLSALSLNMFLPSLANIAGELRADYALVSLSVAGYMAVTAIVQLIAGPLSDRYGRRPLLLVSLALFTLASLGCMLATDVWLFLGFRLLQAAVIVCWILSLAVIRDTAGERRAASRIGYVTMAMAIAPMLGPLAGGLLDELFGWRASFAVFLGLGAALLALCWIDLGETHRGPPRGFAQQFRSYPQLLGSGRFRGYALCMMFSTGAFYAFLAGAPLVAQAVLGLAPGELGFWMGTGTAGFVLGSWLSGRHAGRHALTTMMITGRLVASAGLAVGLGLILAGFVNVWSLFGACVCAGLGNGLTMPSSNTGALSVRPDLAGSASGLAGALTVGGGAALSALTGALVTEAHGAWQLPAMMLLCSVVALLAALHVRRVERAEAASRPGDEPTRGLREAPARAGD